MPTFAEAVKKADATGLPVVEGFAVQVEAGVSAQTVTDLLLARLPGHAWTPEKVPVDWLIYRSAAAAQPAPEAPSLGQAWETVRALQKLPGILMAEPLLLARLPVATETEAQRQFSLWGRIPDDRLQQIQDKSNEANRHWSLIQMGVCDANGLGGAWAAWTASHPGEEPGAGILVAHPDTGYTAHPRLLPRLATRPGDPAGNHGRNFVEPDLPDAATNGLDPLKDRSLGKFPGHGTGTASVIAAGHDVPDHPWGVAPGAKLIPLRVSSSVIHLSFDNLGKAFDEAINRGAHVISMSLGGPMGSKFLNAQVHRALDAGILVISAAGNDAPTVVFPALIPGVLACAASNVLAAPWRFSGLGSEVAITAPGELAWHDQARLDPSLPVDAQTRGSGTSFATANVAGLAALWLSFHGRNNLIAHCGGQPGLLPFLFRLCLQATADATPNFIRSGRGGFGAGIARADRLLDMAFMALPTVQQITAERDRILAEPVPSLVTFPASSLRNILTLPTLAEGEPQMPTDAETAKREDVLTNLLREIAGAEADQHDVEEIGTLAATDLALQSALERVVRSPESHIAAAVRRYLLRDEKLLSATLRDKLRHTRKTAWDRWIDSRPELNEKGVVLPTLEDEAAKIAYAIAAPPARRLRAYAFDPSLATRSADVAINEIVISVVFERLLTPGPVGDYLEVVDVDPASDCAYAPVDLNHPFLLAQDGLPRSEGNPQFHQQMVYAVAMKTIGHFEEALGRPIFWSSLRPWNLRSGDAERLAKLRPSAKKAEVTSASEDLTDRFVQRLRLYPHALRDQNAYYSPQKRAILFGYFPAGDGDPGTEYPGGVVFTCLAHDIVAHETTHAILDGMHSHFIEPTNPDVLAFHEAFADIVALFQRFTYPELLRNQIARVRGRLDAGSLMTQLALQFGAATGRHQALRDALGHVVRQVRRKREDGWRDLPPEPEMDGGGPAPATLADAARDLSDVQTRELWQRFRADPSLLKRVLEPHERGSILVAAVFDAYLTIYENRVTDLKRIATGGTGILPEGDLHPDLVGRMADEAALSARHVLRMCLRAMDYVPPLDITFGEFLRALITADFDLVPDDERRYRVAFIEAFRKWGIYPREVRTLSEESLRWTPPPPDCFLFPRVENIQEEWRWAKLQAVKDVRKALLEWQPGASRKCIFDQIKNAQAELHEYLQGDALSLNAKRALLGGIDTRYSFQVTNLRPARRIGLRGEFLTEMVVEILQSKEALRSDGEAEDPDLTPFRGIPFRGGVTLVVSLDDYCVRYAIHKRIDSASREEHQRSFRAAVDGNADAAEYSSEGLAPGWFSQESKKKKWFKGRNSDVEDMRASSCACRRKDMTRKSDPSNEPFALLHRG